jgi:hypothetical protein
VSLTASPSDPSGTVRCARHPNVETVLRCGRCDTPICARCVVMSPVGARCPTCAQVKRFNLMLKPIELVKSVGYGLAVGAIGPVLLTMVPILQILGLFAYAGIGFAVGEVVSVGANRKRVPILAWIAVGCVFVGYEIGVAAVLLVAGAPLSAALIAPIVSMLSVLRPGGILSSPLIGLLLGALLAWMRTR